MHHDTESEALLHRIAELEARLRAVEAVDAAATDRAEEPRSSRRGLLKLAGAAAVGAVAAGGLGAGPAAATDGEAITLGQTKTATTNRTRADYAGSLIGGQAFLFQSGGTFDGSGGSVSAALAGWAGTAAMPTGIYGFTSQPAAAAIVGRALGTGAAIGAYGYASTSTGYGVKAENANGPALNAVGGTGGVVATSSAIASVAISGTAPSGVDTGGLGVYGEGTIGVQGVAFGATGIGMQAGLPTTGTGLRADGLTAVKAVGAGATGVGLDVSANGQAAFAIKAQNAAAYGVAADIQAGNTGATALVAIAGNGTAGMFAGKQETSTSYSWRSMTEPSFTLSSSPTKTTGTFTTTSCSIETWYKSACKRLPLTG